jgi:hypothetical protein
MSCTSTLAPIEEYYSKLRPQIHSFIIFDAVFHVGIGIFLIKIQSKCCYFKTRFHITTLGWSDQPPKHVSLLHIQIEEETRLKKPKRHGYLQRGAPHKQAKC